MRMIYFDSHFWFLSCHCCCILHPCNFAQLAVLNINQSHMFMSFCQTTTANSSIIPLGNQRVPSISISLLYQGFRGQSHSFVKLRGNCKLFKCKEKLYSLQCWNAAQHRPMCNPTFWRHFFLDFYFVYTSMSCHYFLR